MFWQANISRNSNFRQIFLPTFLLCILTFFHSSRSDDLQVLMKLKESLQQSNTNVFDSWRLDQSLCNFPGIICDSNQFVTEIQLGHKSLSGNLPFDSICQLQSLQKLNVTHNSISGVVTDDLKNCTKLQVLNLAENSLTGAVPDLSSLSELQYLRLDTNGFTGQFPWKSLEGLTNLTWLSVGDNFFDITPFPAEVLKLEKLTRLYLTNCSIEGRIPVGLGKLTEMENLELSMNFLVGEIPGDIVQLSKLWQLQLYANKLSGKFPTGFGNLTELMYLDVSNNTLEGDLSELKSLKMIQNLQLFENQFSGSVPEEFGDFKYLIGLSLYNNKLSGTLPQNIGSWSDFDFIDASDNLLTGPIPPNMCKNGMMTYLSLINNHFTGGIPETYSSCSSLIRLRVRNNLLTGTVPAGIWGLPNLKFSDLSMNQFEGPMTPDIGKAKSLAQLRIQNNGFSGVLPMEISGASSLVSIDVSSNQFSGEIPGSIGELKTLSSLYFQNNLFSGNMPDSVGKCTSLYIMNLAGNSLSGHIPTTLGSLPSLNSLNLSTNQLSGPIPSSLSRLQLSLLDLSNNKLSGLIPQSLSDQASNGSFVGNPGLCSQDARFFLLCSSNSGNSTRVRTLISCFLTATIVLVLLLGAIIFIKKRQIEQEKSFKSDSWQIKSFRTLSFSEEEILKLVKQENLIGKGGSGNVYRVVLETGKELAVKHIWNINPNDQKVHRSSAAMLMKRSGNMPEFEAEVATLSSIRHVNVVNLYCSITSEDSSLLVYEYLPNGSLWDCLHNSGDVKLDWETRYDIAIGAAKGLDYLHHGCDRPVIHRDVKSSNILLDEFFKPRIADFGLAKIMQGNSGVQSTHVITGTHGYIAPEYAYTCKVNEKSDVYSFGVVLIELVTGKKPIEQEFGENKDIVSWVCTKIAKGINIVEMVDSSILEVMKEDAVKVLKIGLICTARLPALRPTMRTVVQMLIDAEPCRLIDITVYKDDDSEKNVVASVEKLKQSP